MSAVRLLVSALCAILLAAAMVLFGVVASLNSTVLRTDFIVAQMEDVPVHTLFAEEAKKQVPTEAAFLMPLIDQAAEELEPWAREQTEIIVRALETYLRGKLAFSATISLEEPKQYLAVNLEEALRPSELPILGHLSETQLRAFLQQILREIDNRIPDAFEITEAFLDAETLEGIRTAREYVGWVTWSLRLLPVLALLLLLLIAVTQLLRGRPIARFVGVALLLAGAGSCIVNYVARSMLPGLLAADMPPEVEGMLPGIIDGCFEPLVIYGVVVALVGAALILLSFKLRPAE